ncbi:TrpB-like pyridoxal phosphate-dependent enzyme [Methanospirillum purgamenti]|jgi:tryptophan synthase beta chain|uniref:Tryptophan synthase beta chain n=1 Tax=Methanospirillum hungatei TaxID=2203 RepID=A0A8F5ZFF3_METHU|nr:TrpB-like pyridoxal phosphate-dependent enzyme [Methanospirillum hungatei]QXO95455.1 TrpB-like pyridoxal phosphate-dependent enzyme [Methanospirillum hungatei]
MNTKIILDENEIPKKWYNIQADLKTPLDPPMHPQTKKPVTPGDLEPIFPKELIRQEMCQDRYIDIPEEIRDIYTLWRPSPLFRAFRLEKLLKTPAKIYYKYEGVSPPGSHKPNTAIAQAYYNMKEGIERIATETGAGQWGSSLAFATQLFGMECKVYMVRGSYDQKPYRKMMMQTWGATCVPSPSPDTNSGRAILEKDPNTPGSLGIAISEAVEDAATHDNTNYSLGSVLNHVCLHQTIIGQEAQKQLDMVDEKADIVIASAGGGSNCAGLCFPFIKDKIDGKNPDLEVLAVEPSACPSLTRGIYAYDFGDVAGLTPLLKMFTLGHDFIPPSIHAGGLRYHGMAPLVSRLHADNMIDSTSVYQNEVFDAAVMFARAEGIIPAPESAHAIRVAIDKAIECKKTGEAKTILFNNSGHGHFDLSSYEAYFAGSLTDYEYPADLIAESLNHLPVIS